MQYTLWYHELCIQCSPCQKFISHSNVLAFFYAAVLSTFVFHCFWQFLKFMKPLQSIAVCNRGCRIIKSPNIRSNWFSLFVEIPTYFRLRMCPIKFIYTFTNCQQNSQCFHAHTQHTQQQQFLIICQKIVRVCDVCVSTLNGIQMNHKSTSEFSSVNQNAICLEMTYNEPQKTTWKHFSLHVFHKHSVSRIMRSTNGRIYAVDKDSDAANIHKKHNFTQFPKLLNHHVCHPHMRLVDTKELVLMCVVVCAVKRVAHAIIDVAKMTSIWSLIFPHIKRSSCF